MPIFVPEMNNTRFATAIHILTLLANFPDEWLSSDWIAGSININPVIVRKELSMLQNAGLVTSRKGKEGGSKLNKPSHGISLAEIYLSVKNSEVLGKKNLSPNPQCPVGKDINENLDKLFAETDQWVIDSLRHKTLKDFVKQFR
ncbi:MAG: Rrf2 family transcriptional regulator [Proteiniphilum sp.]|jgi:Rrf2 family protein|uniref:Rrf2 family transcriptional regulator n=1 Tax=Proteiniphilum sp. TaxID=1926877 RepID=UPI000A981E17|nr:Rrf2 family transcriptional regulator [Proteiniphilum sp.]MEA5127850.1 Rrf2 family transcriptional regulator [Proteiniphilum sp.]